MERRDLEIEKVEVNSPLICINVNLREFNQRLILPLPSFIQSSIYPIIKQEPVIG